MIACFMVKLHARICNRCMYLLLPSATLIMIATELTPGAGNLL